MTSANRRRVGAGSSSGTSLALAIACVAIPSLVQGQSPTERVARSPASVDADPSPAERETSAIVVANAEPRSFRVVSIGVPTELAGRSNLHYEILPTGRATILGARRGTVDARSTTGAVVLTLGVPADAAGGRARAAVVRFAVAGAGAIRVPVELEVAGASRIEITPRRPMRGAERGDHVALTFAIRNAGNVRDTLDLTVEAPGSWVTRFAEPPRVVLEPGEVIDRTIIVTVATSSDLGDFGIALVATGRAGTRSRGVTMVEITDGARTGFESRPVLTMGVGSVGSLGNEPRAVESIALQGPIADGITVAGRLSAPLPSDAVASRALTMLGYSPRSDFLSIAGADWSTTVGNTGVALPEVGGQTLFGRGGSFRLGSGPRGARLFAAVPSAGGSMSWNQSSLIGASVGGAIGAATVTAFLSHLRDSSYTIRALDAAGVDMEMRPWTDGFLSGQLAARSYRGGSGLGAAAVVRSPIAGGQIDFQVTHAPGGSEAFALASDALTVAAERAFGRLHAEVSYWSMRDEQGTASGDLGSSGWSLSPAYAVLPTLTLSSYVQGSTYSANGADGRFASSQRDLGMRGTLVHGGFELTADSRLSTVARAIDAASRAIVDDDARRVTNRLRLDHSGARGEIGVGGSMETSIVGMAAMPAQATIDAHVDRLQLIPWLPHLTFSGSTQRLRFGDAALTTSRVEANLDLQRSTRIVFGIERGTARDASGVLQTVLTLKVERAARLPSLGHRNTRGIVFEDRNGNGVRDPDEPGVPGIVVRRGARSAITNGTGVFQLDESAAGRAEVDPRSLPRGWLPSPRALGDSTDELSLGVIPTAALDVDVKLVTVDDGGSRAVRLGRAALVLRDSAGRVWAVRTDDALRATFDALPVGMYTLAAELEESSEPLLVDPIAPFEITSGATRQHVTIVVRTRPLHMFRGQP